MLYKIIPTILIIFLAVYIYQNFDTSKIFGSFMKEQNKMFAKFQDGYNTGSKDESKEVKGLREELNKQMKKIGDYVNQGINSFKK